MVVTIAGTGKIKPQHIILIGGDLSPRSPVGVNRIIRGDITAVPASIFNQGGNRITRRDRPCTAILIQQRSGKIGTRCRSTRLEITADQVKILPEYPPLVQTTGGIHRRGIDADAIHAIGIEIALPSFFNRSQGLRTHPSIVCRNQLALRIKREFCNLSLCADGINIPKKIFPRRSLDRRVTRIRAIWRP